MAKVKKADPELLAMSRIERILSGLDQPARNRVLAWLQDRATQRELEKAPESDRTEPPF